MHNAVHIVQGSGLSMGARYEVIDLQEHKNKELIIANNRAVYPFLNGVTKPYQLTSL